MANVTQSLFPALGDLLSPSLESVYAQQFQQASRPGDAMQAATGLITGAGARLNQGISGLFGQQPQAFAERDKLRAITAGLQQQGVDVTTPEGMLQLAQTLDQFPEFTEGALRLRQQAAMMAQQRQQQALEQQLTQAKIGTEGFRQTKLAAEAEAKLRGEGKEATQYKVLTKEEATALGLPTDKGQTYQQNLKTNQVTAVGGGGIAVNIPSPEKDLTKSMELRNNFRNETKDIDAGLNALYNVNQLLGERSGLADAIAKRQFAKFSGDRDISNKDIAAFGNFGSLGQRLEGIFNQFLAGTYSPAQVEEASRIADNLLKSLQSKRSQLENQYTSEAKARNVEDSRIDFIVPKFAAPTTKERIPVPANVVAQKGWKQGQKVKRGNKSYTFDGTQLIED